MTMQNLPQELNAITEIASNYWWSWNQESYELFEAFDPESWKKTRTPLITISNALKNNPNHVKELAKDTAFVTKINLLKTKLNNYMTNTTHSQYSRPQNLTGPVAYFSAEFGIHESLPIYSGGLGVLAGDHVKSASDLNLPLLFIGLFYKNGYFTQKINAEGQQEDHYDSFNAEELALEEVKNAKGEKILLTLKLADQEVLVQVWKAQVGRVPLYLLDSNVEGNTAEQRDITARLYGGDREMRISQEIILGIGGIKLIQELGIEPHAYHMNEGHSGFFQLERIKNTMKEKNISFEDARLLCSTNCLFTTHTPVPAGNEAFELPLMHKYFHNYIEDLDISWHRFLSLGLVNNKSDWKFFSLTVFAINVARFYNGVSQLHGDIARRMWANLWDQVPAIDNPISYITNGVHTQTWMANPTKALLNESFGEEWKENIINQNYWNKVNELSNDKIITTKTYMKNKMVGLVRERLEDQYNRFGDSTSATASKNYLDDRTLTIGFARRFATYKRATLIFKDLDRLNKIVNNPQRPVQFIFAGKAHPQDIPGQTFIKEIFEISERPEFKGKIIMLEGYDMNISSHMVAGVDVWLNNPRRPMEASGTSGQKVPINFGLNFSVLDGWWREGYNEENGWTIGDEKDYPSDQVQDFEDAHDFYNTLEQTIAPLYYDNPTGWWDKCKNSFISTVTRYGTDRMVSDYADKFYAPACAYRQHFDANPGKNVENYITTRRFLNRNWEFTSILSSNFGSGAMEVGADYAKYATAPHHHVDFNIDDTLPGRVFEAVNTQVSVELYLGDITPENVIVELVITDREKNTFETKELTLSEHSDLTGTYKANLDFKAEDNCPKHLRLRYFPTLKGLQNKFEFETCTWL